MRIPVLAVLPHQEPLVESAAAAAESRTPNIPMESVQLPPSIAIDPTMAAVPVGTGRVEDMTPAALTPEGSQSFMVRGFIEAESPESIPEEADGVPLFADPVISPFRTCGGTPPVGDSTDVAARLKTAALHSRGLDGTGVAVAVLDTGINLNHLQNKLGSIPLLDAAASWQAPNNPNPPGRNPVDHGTMCAYDVLLAAPKATLLDFPILSGTAPGGSVTGRTLSVALQAFAHLLAFWAVAFAPGGAPRYKGLVVSNSWGIFHPSWDFPPGHPGRYIDNPKHPFQGIVSILAGSGADIVFAAGNCGSQCADGRCQSRTSGTIMGVNASPDVLTLAGCDTNDVRVGYSSQGPSIAGMFQHKPDVTAYTHFLGSEAFGAGSPDSGTSAACPVAAGCVAALRTKLPASAVPPANLFDQLRATARQVGAVPGWNPDHGFGIIDADTAAQTMGV